MTGRSRRDGAPSPVLRTHRADAFTVILWGGAAAALAIAAATLDVSRTFRPEGLAITVTTGASPVAAPIEGTSLDVAGIASEMTVIASGVDAVSAACAAASIALTLAAQLVVVAAVMHLAWNFLRGRFFTASTTRDLHAVSIAVLVGALGVLMLDRMAHNGVLQALGAEETEPLHPLHFWAITPYVFASVAISLLALAFRRGAELQKDTEGLV